MTQNEALILDHLIHIRIALDETRSDLSDLKASLDMIEHHVAECLRPRLRVVADAPGVANS